MAIYDLAGHLVRRLHSGALTAGANRFHWDGRDQGGRLQAAGIYLVRATAGTQVASARLIRLR